MTLRASPGLTALWLPPPGADVFQKPRWCDRQRVDHVPPLIRMIDMHRSAISLGDHLLEETLPAERASSASHDLSFSFRHWSSGQVSGLVVAIRVRGAAHLGTPSARPFGACVLPAFTARSGRSQSRSWFELSILPALGSWSTGVGCGGWERDRLGVQPVERLRARVPSPGCG